MNYFKLLFLLTGLLVIFSTAFAAEEDFKDFAELDLEELLNTTVISSSKREQKLSESANAIYVITAEDIKRSGAVNVPDVLRMAPGMDVVNVYGNTFGASARGFNERFAHRMLVVIDGRSIYTTFFGGVFWENQQVFLEDIERIEIIRGPGATLWGTNAVNGVINIITKDPEADQGLMVTGKVGTKQFREAVTRYSDTIEDKLSFSLTGGYREDQGTRGIDDSSRIPKATGRLKYHLSDNSLIHFLAGFNESQVGLEFSMYTPRTGSNVRSNFQTIRWEHTFSDKSRFQLQYYHNYYAAHSADKEVNIDERTHNVEFQHNFQIGTRNHIVWGAHYRNAKANSHYLNPNTDHDDVKGFYLQDDIKLLDNLTFIAGIQYEDNSFTGGDWSPRGCLIYSPLANHVFRFSVSKAYQTPSFAKNSFWHTKKAPQPFPNLPMALVVGNEHLDTEEMTSFELGYRTIFFKKLGFNLEFYYNEIDNVVIEKLIAPTFPLLVTWDNCFKAIAKGVEITADVPITPWWSLKANYTFQEVENKRANRDVQGTPKHKFNIWSSFTFKHGITLDLIAHYVDDTKWHGLLADVKVDDYWSLNARLAKKLCNDRVEVSVAGLNLNDKLHPETSDGLATYEVERLIYGQLTFKY